MRTIFPCWDNGEKGGRVQCDICGSFKGVIAKNYYRKDKEGKGYLKLFCRCANCRSLEVRNNDSGEIISQVRREINMKLET